MSNALQVTDFVSSLIVANPEVGVRSDSGRYTALPERIDVAGSVVTLENRLPPSLHPLADNDREAGHPWRSR